MSGLTRIRRNELSTDVIQGVLKDSSLVVVPGSTVTACELTLWDVEAGPPVPTSPADRVINDRYAVDMIGTGEMTIDEAGAWTWFVDAADNQIVNPRRQIERHRVRLHFMWSADAVAADVYEHFEIEVVNLQIA